MKKTTFAMLCAALCLAGATAQAVTINLTSGILYKADGVTPLDDGSTLVLIADTALNGFGNLESPTLALATSFANQLDDKIVGTLAFALNSATFGLPGGNIQALNFNLGDNGVTAGAHLMLAWYDNNNLSQPGYGVSFGTFGFADDATWVVPSANGANIDLNLLTGNAGGELPEAAGIANQMTEAIPEPTSLALVAMGCLSMFAVRRRKA